MDAGADRDQALFMAVARGCTDVVKTLLAAGAWPWGAFRGIGVGLQALNPKPGTLNPRPSTLNLWGLRVFKGFRVFGL